MVKKRYGRLGEGSGFCSFYSKGWFHILNFNTSIKKNFVIYLLKYLPSWHEQKCHHKGPRQVHPDKNETVALLRDAFLRTQFNGEDAVKPNPKRTFSIKGTFCLPSVDLNWISDHFLSNQTNSSTRKLIKSRYTWAQFHNHIIHP